jgi:hypothetical protein
VERRYISAEIQLRLNKKLHCNKKMNWFKNVLSIPKGFLLVLGAFFVGSCESNFDERINEEAVSKTRAKKREYFSSSYDLSSIYELSYLKRFPLKYLGNHPSGSIKPSYMNGLQGVAISDQKLFFSVHRSISGVSVASFLADPVNPQGRIVFNLNSVPAISSYDHLCDLAYSFSKQLLYVGLEMTNKSRPSKVLLLDKNLNFKRAYDLTYNNAYYGNEAPWVGVSELTNQIYSSKFNGVSEVAVYDLSDNGVDTLLFRKTVPLKNNTGAPIVLDGVQGGEVSPSGHLFLLAQQNKKDKAGVYVFDSITGDYITFIHAPIDGELFPQDLLGRKQEYEGLAIDPYGSIYTGGGNVHTFTYEALWGNYNKAWFKHFSISHISAPAIKFSFEDNRSVGEPNYIECKFLASNFSSNLTVELEYMDADNTLQRIPVNPGQELLLPGLYKLDDDPNLVPFPIIVKTRYTNKVGSNSTQSFTFIGSSNYYGINRTGKDKIQY